MNIKELVNRPDLEKNQKLTNAYLQFNKLLLELTKRELPDELVEAINTEVDTLNSATGAEKQFKKQLKRSQTAILKRIEKEVKLVTKKHYLRLWMVLGMTIFGAPLGIAFGTSLDNMAFLGIGLPIGMAIGLVLGAGMDKKAFEEGRQLDLEIKY